jgi:SGNH domain (fused to AT3 domains)
MFPFLRDAAAARGVDLESAARIGCSVIDGDPKLDDGRPHVDIYGDTSQCDAITSSEQDRLLATHRPDVVVWLSEWEAWPNRVLDGQLVHFGTIPGNKAILAHIDAAVARLTAGGARLVFLPTAPRAYPSVRGLRTQRVTRASSSWRSCCARTHGNTPTGCRSSTCPPSCSAQPATCARPKWGRASDRATSTASISTGTAPYGSPTT